MHSVDGLWDFFQERRTVQIVMESRSNVPVDKRCQGINMGATEHGEVIARCFVDFNGHIGEMFPPPSLTVADFREHDAAGKRVSGFDKEMGMR